MKPALGVGDLVKHRDANGEHLGIILEIEETPRYVGDAAMLHLGARVLWDDLPGPYWHSVALLVPVQPDGDRGITG